MPPHQIRPSRIHRRVGPMAKPKPKSIQVDPQLLREALGLYSPEQIRSFKENLSDEEVFNMIPDRHPDARVAWTVRYRPDSGRFHVPDHEWVEIEKRVDRECAKRPHASANRTETKPESKFLHSDDFHSVSLDGIPYSLTSKQAEVIQ